MCINPDFFLKTIQILILLNKDNLSDIINSWGKSVTIRRILCDYQRISKFFFIMPPSHCVHNTKYVEPASSFFIVFFIK